MEKHNTQGNSTEKTGNSSNSTVKVEPANGGTTNKPTPVKVEKSSRGENGKFEQPSLRPEKLAKTEKGPIERKPENCATVKVESSSAVEPVKVGPTLKKHNGPPKLTSMVKTNDPIRDKMRDLLLEALSKVPNEADESYKDEVDASDPIRVVINVENVMFEKWGRSNGAHKFKYRSIMFNIKDTNNPDFRRKVLLGYIKPERIVNLTAEKMQVIKEEWKTNRSKRRLFSIVSVGAHPRPQQISLNVVGVVNVSAHITSFKLGVLMNP